MPKVMNIDDRFTNLSRCLEHLVHMRSQMDVNASAFTTEHKKEITDLITSTTGSMDVLVKEIKSQVQGDNCQAQIDKLETWVRAVIQNKTTYPMDIVDEVIGYLQKGKPDPKFTINDFICWVNLKEWLKRNWPELLPEGFNGIDVRLIKVLEHLHEKGVAERVLFDIGYHPVQAGKSNTEKAIQVYEEKVEVKLETLEGADFVAQNITNVAISVPGINTTVEPFGLVVIHDLEKVLTKDEKDEVQELLHGWSWSVLKDATGLAQEMSYSIAGGRPTSNISKFHLVFRSRLNTKLWFPEMVGSKKQNLSIGEFISVTGHLTNTGLLLKLFELIKGNDLTIENDPNEILLNLRRNEHRILTIDDVSPIEEPVCERKVVGFIDRSEDVKVFKAGSKWSRRALGESPTVLQYLGVKPSVIPGTRTVVESMDIVCVYQPLSTFKETVIEEWKELVEDFNSYSVLKDNFDVFAKGTFKATTSCESHPNHFVFECTNAMGLTVKYDTLATHIKRGKHICLKGALTEPRFLRNLYRWVKAGDLLLIYDKGNVFSGITNLPEHLLTTYKDLT